MYLPVYLRPAKTPLAGSADLTYHSTRGLMPKKS